MFNLIIFICVFLDLNNRGKILVVIIRSKANI